MRIAILTFDGFDDVDTFVPFGLLNRLSVHGWKAEIASPSSHVTSMSGLTVQAQQPLEFANEADAVIVGGGLYARALAENSALVDRLQFDPLRQSFAALGSGVLLLARLGLLADMPAATDAATRPWLIEAGIRVVDASFHARGAVATSCGGLAAPTLAAWLMVLGAGRDAARQALLHAAPAGDREACVERLLDEVAPFLPGAATADPTPE